MAEIKLLLDDHYPPVLADRLSARGIDAQAVISGDDLRGSDDFTVLRQATLEHRIVVTEDVNTFPDAMALVVDHCGVIFCDHYRFPRTAAARGRLEHALVRFVSSPPVGVGLPGFVWWLEP